MTLRYGLIVALVLALASAFSYWFYSNFEKERTEKEIGFLGEARLNPLLAAQRYFQSFGVAARSAEGLTILPPSNTTLILPSARYEMGSGETQRLKRWVESGGHLVLVPSAAFDAAFERKDLFLDPLGIGVKGIKDPETAGIVDVDWPASTDFMTIKINAYTRLNMDGDKDQVLLELADDDGAYLIRLRLGQGIVTVLSNAGFITNSNLSKNDHAVYLWRVALADDKQRPVWLVYSDGMPPLHRWLLQHAWTVLISASVLLLLWLWSASRRFGPLRAIVPLARRRLLDHIEASGRFLWRAGQGEQLLKGVRQALYRALELRHPAWAGISSHDLYQRLAELSGLPYETVQGALLYTHHGSEHEFTQAIQTLERIRKSL